MLDDVPVLHTRQDAVEGPAVTFYRQGGFAWLGFDIVRATFWLLSREEELAVDRRDELGRFDDAASWLVRHGLAETPVVDRYAALLAELLMAAAYEGGSLLPRKCRWPKGKRYAVVLSHDVDDAGRFSARQGMRLLLRGARQASPRGIARGAYFALAGLGRRLSQQPDPYWNFEEVMDLEAGAGFRSTFFFVPQATSANRDPPYEVDTPRLRDLLGRLHQGGWEIGVHGSFASYLNPEMLRAQRLKLERIAGGAVHGVRQHYLRLRVADTFRAQAKAGFLYDSTLGYRSAVGFRGGAAFPFHPYDVAGDQPLSLLELPLGVMDGSLFWQLQLSPEAAAARTIAVLQTVRSVSGLAVLLWHQRVRYEKRYPGWWHVYCQVVDYLREEGLAWVATAGQIADWWLGREAVSLEETAKIADPAGGKWRWRFRAGRVVEHLAFELEGVNGRGVTVSGVEAAVHEVEGGVRLAFQPLAENQPFEIVVSESGGLA
jgi:peptidoglycan/xylan/chitin deacetylase (PgdA/CDA1 family)